MGSGTKSLRCNLGIHDYTRIPPGVVKRMEKAGFKKPDWYAGGQVPYKWCLRCGKRQPESWNPEERMWR